MTPTDPAAVEAPRPRRRAARTVPGGPAVAPGPLRDAAAGGKTSPKRRERAPEGISENGLVPAGRSSLPGSPLEQAEPGTSSPPVRPGPRAGMPVPETGATSASGVAPVRGTAPSPAGGAVGAATSLPAGPRTYTIALPAGMKLLSQNMRLHHFERNRRAQVLKTAAWLTVLREKIPPLERVSIVVEYQPRDSRDTDPDNVPPASGKPCIDGIVAAGILPDDNSRYVTSVSGKIGPKFPRGRIVLHITEVTP